MIYLVYNLEFYCPNQFQWLKDILKYNFKMEYEKIIFIRL